MTRRRLRALKAKLWLALEWVVVMTTFGWLLAHARTVPASLFTRKRRPARRRRSASASAARTVSPRKEIARPSALLS